MKKIVSTILLDQHDNYLCYGKLPIYRPEWDKKLLTALCKGEVVSNDGIKCLPKSISDIMIHTSEVEPHPVTVPEIDGLTDILIVVRTDSKCNLHAKRFRFDRFRPIVKTDELEIWERK